MPVTVEVKAQYDPIVKGKRELTAQNVLRKFGHELPELKLLAFFDDEDPDYLRQALGPANRGFYGPIKTSGPWPPRMADLIFVFADEPLSSRLKRAFDHGIYLHGSTCADETALTMTFAHELQHFIQYGFNRKLWAEGRLIGFLPKKVIDIEGLNWPDIPHEREARIRAKRVGVELCGANAVNQYINSKISENVNAQDVADWRFSQNLDPSARYDLATETRRIFQRLRPHRQALESCLQEMKNSDFKDEYKDIDFADYFDAV